MEVARISITQREHHGANGVLKKDGVDCTSTEANFLRGSLGRKRGKKKHEVI